MKLLILLHSLPFIFADNPLVYVNTSRGQLFGYHVDYGNGSNSIYKGQADVFLGIPYVMPPVGSRRFAKPEKLQTFSSNGQAWNATLFRPQCPQQNSTVQTTVNSEDCLYLNVFTPMTNPSAKYPVMFWIHGGAYVTGSASAAYYAPKGGISNLVTRGIVLVSINYRLGMLGFFTTFTDEFPPNLGLLDQVEAMRFVNEEISNFGGDPKKITIFGESSGGISVSAHTYSPLSRGLFQQAIMESGVVWTGIDYPNGFIEESLSFACAQALCNVTKEEWNGKNYASLKECLLNMDYNKFLAFNQWSSLDWKVAIDGSFFTDIPERMYKQRPNIPVLYGSNKDEWALTEIDAMAGGLRNLTDYNRTVFEQELATSMPELLNLQPNVDQILTNIYMPHGENQSNHLYWLNGIIDVFTGGLLTGYIARDAGFYVECNNTNVFLYEFTYRVGTSKQDVTQDYIMRLLLGWTAVEEVINNAMQTISQNGKNNSMTFPTQIICRNINESECLFTRDNSFYTVTVHNVNGQTLNTLVKVPLYEDTNNVIVLDSEGNHVDFQFIQLDFDVQGRLSTFIDLTTNKSYPLAQEFSYYHGASFNQPSGAYVFRPSPQSTFGFSDDIYLQIVNASIVQEARQIISPWISQTIRLIPDKKYVEFEWTIGPIPNDPFHRLTSSSS